MTSQRSRRSPRLIVGCGLAAGGDPKVGRPGMSEGSSATWLTAQGKTNGQAGGRAFLTEERSCSSGRSNDSMWTDRRFNRRSVVDSHEGAITRSKQKLCIDQGTQQRVTRRGVEPPQAARLRFGESQSWHFEELSLDAPEHIVIRADRLGRHVTSNLLLGMRRLEQPICQRDFCQTGPPASPRRAKTGLISPGLARVPTDRHRPKLVRCCTRDTTCRNLHQVARAGAMSPNLHLSTA
jgi:hypothetical protein